MNQSLSLSLRRKKNPSFYEPQKYKGQHFINDYKAKVHIATSSKDFKLSRLSWI